MKDVTALIKTFLRDDYLFDCVKSLRTTYPAMTIFVADDGRFSDEKEEALRALGVTRYLHLPFNCGLSRGRNILLDVCETPYLLLSDDDHVFTPDTHAEYLRTLMDIADIAAGGFLEGGEIFHYERNFTRNSDGRFNLLFPHWPQFETYEGVRYGRCHLTHNFFVARTDVIRRIRWDDDLRIRYEHEDFFMRAWLQGVRVVYSPDVSLLHKMQNYPHTEEYRSCREDSTVSGEAFIKKWGFIW